MCKEVLIYIVLFISVDTKIFEQLNMVFFSENKLKHTNIHTYKDNSFLFFCLSYTLVFPYH